MRPTSSSSSPTGGSCRRRCWQLPRLGRWNVHASLLPRLRGAAPIQWAIIRGESRTGVAVMRMEAGLDTGPVAAVDGDAHRRRRHRRRRCSSALARLGADLLAGVLPRILDGSVTLTAQDDAQATLAPPLEKEDGRLDFRQTGARGLGARARRRSRGRARRRSSTANR